jgi:hypothetical protein
MSTMNLQISNFRRDLHRTRYHRYTTNQLNGVRDFCSKYSLSVNIRKCLNSQQKVTFEGSTNLQFALSADLQVEGHTNKAVFMPFSLNLLAEFAVPILLYR